MATRQGTWDGGYIRQTEKGRNVYIIRQQINGKRYDISTRAFSLEAAHEHLRRFQSNPEAYDPRGERLPVRRREMASLAKAQARRQYVSNAFSRFLYAEPTTEKTPMNRSEIFRQGGASLGSSYDWTEMSVLKTLNSLGVIEKVKGRKRGKHAEIYYLLKDRRKLEKILKDPVELTGVIWPSSAMNNMPTDLIENEDDEIIEPEPGLIATPTVEVSMPAPKKPEATNQEENKSPLLAQIAEQQTAILEVLAKPLVDNLVYIRDKVLGLEAKIKDLQNTMDQILEEITKPLTPEELSKLK